MAVSRFGTPLTPAIVIFGAPGSTIKNNRIVSQTQTLLGGINLVDTHPWLPEGTFAGTVVENNQITGEFATGAGDANRGPNEHGAIIKVGIVRTVISALTEGYRPEGLEWQCRGFRQELWWHCPE